MVKIGTHSKKRKHPLKMGTPTLKKYPTQGAKIGAKPVKIPYGIRGDSGGGSVPYQGGLLQYTIDSPPEAYAQQQAITGELHNAYLDQLTPGLNDLIGAVVKGLEFLLDKDNWLTIGGVIIGIFLVLLTVNALVQSEGKAAISGALQSQGFSIPKRKNK